ncbi:CaiB/BaiF CoA transferase family protein [Caldimonas brevitalea]|uniref:Carnitine dehydratase n=1 Tax=Caldimonas brevitalea TaxID=413882 RepID=A0A0G3BPW5_9BURK|nr:CaiB/BaiF CoA-transferase family protein [Caldimonas brevitalea]AKJ30028.1 carnitine dehydratase [Caldimonas brevitalea]
MNDDDLPLAGTRVLDLTRLLPGPFACWHLRRLGADVLKIEGPGTGGDGARTLLATDAERVAGQPSLFYRLLNEGKRERSLDVRHPEGRHQLLALVGEADVLVEGYRPGVMAALGLGWECLSAVNPRLVMCSISGYGQQGPWANRAGHDLNYIGCAGVLGQITAADGSVAMPNFQIGDLLGGTQAAVSAILAALLAVARSGRGRHLDVSMTHTVFEHNIAARVGAARPGGPAGPGRDLLDGGVPCYNVYRTLDQRWMAVGALELKFWRRVCEVLQRPDWAQRHWALGQEVGGADAMALRADVAERFASRTQSDWVALFDPADCCVTPVLTMEEAVRHPLFAPDRSAPDDLDTP